MNKEELLKELNSDRYKWNGNGHGIAYEESTSPDGRTGFLISNRDFAKHEEPFHEDDTIFVYDDMLKNLEFQTIEVKSHMGRNVDGITRVTGFFSKTSAFNRGKKSELDDRYRSDISQGLDN